MAAVIIGTVIGLAILFGTIFTVRAIAMGPPPEPDPDAVQEVEMPYRCSVCGMQVTVTHLQDAAPNPPRHCREDMDPVPA
ncbi:MAG: hypothetical protein BMS9Abin07_0172 [Acidimicrobiia bacterium]|nr:MAG: hypothetical protein BMS9Abin07_0172 [Acidimicrobiia bacterium]